MSLRPVGKHSFFERVMGWLARDDRQQQLPERKTSEALLRQVLEHGQEYEKIVNDYGAVIQTTLSMRFGAPESLLPHPKEEMKKAITSYVIYLDLTKQLDAATLDLMKAGYIRLARFISDAKARDAAVAAGIFEHATTDTAKVENAKEWANRLASPTVVAAIEVQKQIVAETNVLLREFEAFLATLKIVPKA